MSVKLSRYLFKKIGGKIVPMRKGLELATKTQSELAEKIVTKSKDFSFPGFNKLGSGIDFTAYRSGDDVIKVQKTWGRNTTRGTSNKWFNKQWPETKDKLAVTKALSDNLPNFGIPTEESKIIRLSKGKRGILQRYVDENTDYIPHRNEKAWLAREAEKLLKDHGLNIDAHGGNIRSGRVIDSGGNLLKSQIKKVRGSDTAKEILGLEGHYNTLIKDHVNKAEVLSQRAAIEGQSPAILRKLNSLKKKGWKFVSSAKSQDEAKFINPIPTKGQKLNDKTVRFIRKNGRIIPIFNKNRNKI